jgi:hypothetical protein
MNWTRIPAEAGIPEPPGYRETVEAMADRRLLTARAREQALRKSDEAYRRKLAAQGDKRKAVRSKVRVGA